MKTGDLGGSECETPPYQMAFVDWDWHGQPCDTHQPRIAKPRWGQGMKLKVIVHPAEEGGYWAEVPAIPGCVTQGESFEELLSHLYEAIEACMSVDITDVQMKGQDKVLEIAV